jgi:hypothetical protein
MFELTKEEKFIVELIFSFVIFIIAFYLTMPS